MDNETKIKLSFANSVTGEKKLEKYEERLKNIYGLIDGLGSSQSQNTMDKISKDASKLDKNVKSANTSSIKLAETLRKAFNVAKVVAMTKSLWKLTQTMMKLSQKSVEYIENVNLLEVAYKNQNETIEESSKRIETYIDKMSEVYGLDESRLTRQFGIFKQLANAMELPTETAENLSEIMVKMTNDIASLYNLDLNRASNALQSALAGQVRPIRSATGADITEKTLQNTVDSLGLDRSISQLSYVEKRLVMVISLTNQLKNSQGDYARTIESASNQIRVMKEQWDRLSRAVGNVFYPILEAVLPYINAILMALTEVINLFARLVGFKMPEFDYSGLTGVSDTAMDIEDEMNGAGEATDQLANKLKGLRGFDKLNVISSPSDSGKSSSGVGGGTGGIDPKIMDAFNNAFANYNDMMDTVQMKATKIRDSIMEWLGFTKLVDEETGEISWKYEGIGGQLGGIAESIYNAGSSVIDLLGTIGDIIVTSLSGDTATQIFDNIYQTWVNIFDIITNVSDALNNALQYGNNGYEIFESLLSMLNNVHEIVRSVSSSLKKWTLSESFQNAIKNIMSFLNDLLGIISQIADWITDIYVEYGEPVMNDFLELLSEAVNAISAVWDVVKPIVNKIIEALEKWLGPVIKRLLEWIDDIINILKNLLQFITAVFQGDWEKAWDAIVGVIKGVVDFIWDSVMYVIDVFANFGIAILDIFGGIGNWIKDVLKGAWDFVVGIWKGAENWFKGIVGGIEGVFKTAFDNIYNTVSGAWSNIVSAFSTGGEIFIGIVNGVADTFKTMVKFIIEGINQVIKVPFDSVNGVLNTIRNIKIPIVKVKPFTIIPKNAIPVPQIPTEFANGGLPPVGQMFIANEKGPELVGQIGGKSFVANQNQMMDLLDKKIGNAQSSKPQVFNIYLDADHKIGTYTLDQLEDMAKTNGQPITIGG